MPGYLVLAGVVLVFGLLVKQASDSNRYRDDNGVTWILGTSTEVDTGITRLSARPSDGYAAIPQGARVVYANDRVMLVDTINAFAWANRALA